MSSASATYTIWQLPHRQLNTAQITSRWDVQASEAAFEALLTWFSIESLFNLPHALYGITIPTSTSQSFPHCPPCLHHRQPVSMVGRLKLLWISDNLVLSGMSSAYASCTILQLPHCQPAQHRTDQHHDSHYHTVHHVYIVISQYRWLEVRDVCSYILIFDKLVLSRMSSASATYTIWQLPHRQLSTAQITRRWDVMASDTAFEAPLSWFSVESLLDLPHPLYGSTHATSTSQSLPIYHTIHHVYIIISQHRWCEMRGVWSYIWMS